MNRYFKRPYAAGIMLLLAGLTACQNPRTNGADGQDFPQKERYRAAGEKLAAQAQASLMQQVKKALREGGPVHAIDYCHAAADSLTAAAAKQAGARISRIAQRNRNPANGLETKAEKEAFAALAQLAPRYDTSLVRAGAKRVTFFKPIPLAMNTCLKCHGTPQKEVAPETLAAIAERYPEDKALNFKLGELRGAWKISFPKVLGE
jgi:hypothetical protein